MKKYLPLILILSACLGMLIYYNMSKYKKPERVMYLPYYGNKDLDEKFDTIYHSISTFKFINQNGDTISNESVKGKNYVTEFFFTTCQSICPIMNKNMMIIANKIKGDSNFKILSHTVKPHQDSVPVLLDYAKSHNADNNQWYFLTGNKSSLFNMARYSYLVTTDSIQDNSPDDFVHTQLFVLVDKQSHIRGYYDGTSDADINKLIRDIDLLKKEQQLNNTK